MKKIFDWLDRFERYMDRPNKLYLAIGIAYMGMGFFIYIFNPVVDLNLINGTFKPALMKMLETEVINCIFQPGFYWAMGAGHIAICGLYYFSNRKQKVLDPSKQV